MTRTTRFCHTVTPVRALGLITLIGLLSWNSRSADAIEPISEHRLTPIVRAVRNARPAIVNIQGQKSVAVPRSSESTDGMRQVNGMGTGIIIDPRGFILTNFHVVEDVRRINVTLDDGKAFVAELVARDDRTDLAVIKILPESPLPTITIGTSSDLMEGETVIALGNAYGYEHTVTLGIISALHRDVQVSDNQGYDDLIQTDASINPGNSGGPLLNIDGEMVGVNVAVRAGAQGIGFAIPADSALKVASDLLSIERLEKKWHGLVTECVRGHGGPLVVKEVVKSSPAAESGLKPGDIIDKVGSVDMQRPLDLERALLGRRVGEKVEVEVRRDDEPLTLDLVLASRNQKPTPGPTAVATNRPMWDLLGLELREEPQTTFATRNTRYRGGMRVVRVREGGPAADQGIVPGDILVGMHRWETASEQDVNYIVSRPNLTDMGPVKFYVLRGRETLYGQLTIATQPVSTTSR